jgi:hypothetical protein
LGIKQKKQRTAGVEGDVGKTINLPRGSGPEWSPYESVHSTGLRGPKSGPYFFSLVGFHSTFDGFRTFVFDETTST